jgi:hypothetical protein
MGKSKSMAEKPKAVKARSGKTFTDGDFCDDDFFDDDPFEENVSQDDMFDDENFELFEEDNGDNLSESDHDFADLTLPPQASKGREKAQYTKDVSPDCPWNS